MTWLEILLGFVGPLLRYPPIRDLAFQIAVEILTRDDRDPEFKSEYLALSRQLRTARTADEKRPILSRMSQLRRGGTLQ